MCLCSRIDDEVDYTVQDVQGKRRKEKHRVDESSGIDWSSIVQCSVHLMRSNWDGKFSPLRFGSLSINIVSTKISSNNAPHSNYVDRFL